MEPCPFHDGYEQFSSQQRLCAYAEMRAERDRYREALERIAEEVQIEFNGDLTLTSAELEARAALKEE